MRIANTLAFHFISKFIYPLKFSTPFKFKMQQQRKTKEKEEGKSQKCDDDTSLEWLFNARFAFLMQPDDVASIALSVTTLSLLKNIRIYNCRAKL